MSSRGPLVLLTATFVACGYDSNADFDGDGATGSGPGGVTLPGQQPGGGSGGPGGKPDAGPTCGTPPLLACADGVACSQNAECRSAHCVGGTCAPATATDAIQNGTETDVDCGGDAAAPCTVGQSCLVGSDCDQKVCSAANVCQPPTPTDLVQNGTETDIDCGGVDGAPGCAVDQACLVSADCESSGCNYLHKCILHPSCAPHEGGDTCGSGEVDDAARVHQSCCTELPLPSGSKLDKFVVTAGRMRTFIEYTQGNVAGWIAAHKPAWWDAEYGAVVMPTTLAEANFELSADGATGECFIGDSAATSGVRTYWLPDDQNVAFGSGHQGYPQLVLDTKALNCVRRPMIAALCAFDGKRVATQAQLREAWGGVGRKFPWGEADWNSTLAIHDRTYFYPDPLPAFVADQGYHMAAPGRRPLGDGPHGHSDLAGLLFEHGAGGDTISKGSFENHPIAPNAADASFTIVRKYGAIGGRCGRD